MATQAQARKVQWRECHGLHRNTITRGLCLQHWSSVFPASIHRAAAGATIAGGLRLPGADPALSSDSSDWTNSTCAPGIERTAA